jgi:hypothetical protein
LYTLAQIYLLLTALPANGPNFSRICEMSGISKWS